MPFLRLSKQALNHRRGMCKTKRMVQIGFGRKDQDLLLATDSKKCSLAVNMGHSS